MRVLFQGAGAVGLAAAARFTDDHEVAVVSRRHQDSGAVAYPQRLSGVGTRPFQRHVAAVRRVSIIDWSELEDSAWAEGPWVRTAHSAPSRPRRPGTDLLVLTDRPGQLGDSAIAAIRRVSPRILAVTSQVAGDAAAARALFPRTPVVIFSPAFLSERPDGPQSPPAVRHWSPPGTPSFLVAGPAAVVARLCRSLGPLVLAVSEKVLIEAPALFIPFAAELCARGGNWDRLAANLERPTAASAEAVAAVTGIRPPAVPGLAAAVMSVLQTVVPIDLRDYAGRHFLRHIRQTIDMLSVWEERSRGQDAPALRELIEALNAGES